MPVKQTFRNNLQAAASYILRLRDIRLIGQVAFVVIVLLVSWSGANAINTNYGLQKKITALKEQNDLQQLENNNLELQNDYYNSNQYLELSARQNFGLGAPGETELIVPRSVALSYTVAMPQPPAPKPNAEPPAYQRNIQAWVNFFLHRQQQSQ